MQLTKQEAIKIACIQMRRALISLLKALDDFLGYTDTDRPYAGEQ